MDQAGHKLAGPGTGRSNGTARCVPRNLNTFRPMSTDLSTVLCTVLPIPSANVFIMAPPRNGASTAQR
ncbi:MAG: hypothetical protein AUI14_01220 [Actinobacteria bacterium 13_2_20CM_2_71_6]|nr:MAG: hypothetical protein AUI14_01220 [Actinobacteria bacterium 13_2_20CM_2_71_6]